MNYIARIWRFIFALLFAASLNLTSNAATNPRIIPLKTSVSFSPRSYLNRWSVPIKSTGGRTIYVLSLEPNWFPTEDHHQVEGLDIVLRRVGDKRDDSNLLAPTGNWHGAQDFMFLAWDFKQGVKNSMYGEKRTLSVTRLGLVVRIAVSKATVSPVSEKDDQFDELNMQIDVDNLSP